MTFTPLPNRSLLLQYIHYCPDTGIGTWIQKPAFNVEVGKEIGTNKTDLGRTYRYVRFQRKYYMVHRLFWLIYHKRDPKVKLVDHIDGNPLNNKINNLRLVTHSQNMLNCKLRKNNKTGVCGVFFCELRQRYIATIGVDGRTKSLGSFKTLEEASITRKNAFKFYHGNFLTICN